MHNTWEEHTHILPRGGLCSQAAKHLRPPQTPNQATTLTPHPDPCSHPGLSLHLSLPSGLVAMPRIPSRRGNISDLEPAVLHAQIRGWLRQSPRGGRMFLTTKGTLGSFVAATYTPSPVLLPGPPRNPRDLQVPRERPSSPWPSTRPPSPGAALPRPPLGIPSLAHSHFTGSHPFRNSFPKHSAHPPTPPALTSPPPSPISPHTPRLPRSLRRSP